VDFLNYSRTDKEIKEQLGLDPDKRIIGIFPGSRKQEIRNHMNVMLLSAEKLFQRNKDLFFLIPASSDKIKDLIMEVTEKFSYLPLKVIFRRSHDVLKISHMIITSSGSVTLEAACFGTPMVILYILHWFDYLAGKLLIKGVKFIGLPNFLADREIVPELLQQLATSDIIADKSFKILDAPEEVQRIKKELKNTVTTLGEPPVSEKIAQKVLEILNGNKK
jgi:lipid-A-disaccharide synthase